MTDQTTEASATGRVNLIGEWIDFNGGLVMPMALTRQVHVRLQPGMPGHDRICSDRFNGTVTVPVGAPAEGRWPDYVRGALAHARDQGWICGGQDVEVSGDLPAGAGVSSSAAIIIAALRAAVAGRSQLTIPELAATAKRIENDFIGVPCGIMDQMAIAAGRVGAALALDTKTLTFDLIDIPEDWAFLVLDPGVPRALADGRYGQRRQECLDAAERLDCEWLVDAPPRAISGLPEPLARRARHVVREHQRSQAAMHALRSGDRPGFGRLMNESHASLRDDMEVSHPVIDQMVMAARAAGADGARITGAGFGGCFVCLAKSERQEAVMAGLEHQFPGLQRIY